MKRNLTIILSIFAIMYFGVLLVFSIPFVSGAEQTGIDHIVELKDGIIIHSSLTTEYHVSHPLVGTKNV